MCIHLTLSSDTSVTKPSGPAIEGSSTSVFAPLTEFNASTKERLASSLSSEVSTVLAGSSLEVSSAEDAGMSCTTALGRRRRPVSKNLHVL